MQLTRLCLALLLLAATLAQEAQEQGEQPAGGGEEKTAEVEVFEEPPIILTKTGRVSGVKQYSTLGRTFFAYHSIPYAQPPVGELRFKEPVAVGEWEGVVDGSSMPPLCPQIPTAQLLLGMNAEITGQEDCLFLNVFTPKPTNKTSLLPVLVYIHGGAWLSGGALEYPPHVILNQDVVLVTLQYRLGILGFMSTEDLVVPGNMGLRDQTLALTWVQRNVEYFGGDPLGITIFGESAGAASVHFQILSHTAIGLFHRAITHSGSALCPWAMGKDHLQVAEYMGHFFNCTSATEEETPGAEEERPPTNTEDLVTCLRQVNAEDLVAIPLHFSEWQLSPLMVGPRMDGRFLADSPEKLMKAARHKRVDLISGITSHEGALMTRPVFANEGLRSALMHYFAKFGPISMDFRSEDVAPLNQTVRIFDHYLGGPIIDAFTADNFTQMFSDRFFTTCHDLTTSLHAAAVKSKKKKTYRYELTHRGQYSANDVFGIDIGKHWVTHLDDMFYLFSGGPMFAPLEREEDLRLRDIMTKMWVNFAATGDPTPDDSLGFKWEPSDKDDLSFLALSPEPAMQEDSRNQTREFWFSLPLHQNLVLHPEKVHNLVVLPIETQEDQKAPQQEAPQQEEKKEQQEAGKEAGEGAEKDTIKKDEL